MYPRPSGQVALPAALQRGASGKPRQAEVPEPAAAQAVEIVGALRGAPALVGAFQQRRRFAGVNAKDAAQLAHERPAVLQELLEQQHVHTVAAEQSTVQLGEAMVEVAGQRTVVDEKGAVV